MSETGRTTGSHSATTGDVAQVISKMAHLARLELSEQESREFTRQVGDILRYVEQLRELDLEGVEPLTHPLRLATALREDVVVAPQTDAEGKPRVLQSAPETLHDGFKVPPIL